MRDNATMQGIERGGLKLTLLAYSSISSFLQKHPLSNDTLFVFIGVLVAQSVVPE